MQDAGNLGLFRVHPESLSPATPATRHWLAGHRGGHRAVLSATLVGHTVPNRPEHLLHLPVGDRFDELAVEQGLSCRLV